MRTFNFFALPRELRDSIYAYLTEDRKIHDHGGFSDTPTRLWVTVENTLSLTPLLISRRFRVEYENAVRRRERHQMITFTDYGGIFEHKLLPEGARRSTKAKFQLIVICPGKRTACMCDSDLGTSIRWMTHQLQEINSLEAIEIEIRPRLDNPDIIDWSKHPPPGTIDKFKRRIIGPTSVQMTVFPAFLQGDKSVYDAYKDQAPPVSRWNNKE